MESTHDEPETSTSTATNSQPTLMKLNEFKAGLEGLNNNKINEIIHNVSKGSSFHGHQMERQKRIDNQIQKMKSRLFAMSESDRKLAMIEADKMCDELEASRDLSRVIVHFDMDMFFAAVEIRDRPELKDKPVAVGSNMMISTSNYVARKFGVRAAMAGFVGKELCPDLILINPNFNKYSAESEKVMQIIAQYDPFMSPSMDEAYADLTDYITNIYHQTDATTSDSQLPDGVWDIAEKVVQEIRSKIEETTQLTCSAGIASNCLLAKVSTDVNKPNGQFMLRGNKQTIKQFISKTSARKIPGIGPVSGQIISALGINTCAQIWEKRDIITFLFSPFSARSFLKSALGIGTTTVTIEGSRKSKSVERTYGELSDTNEICEKLKQLSSTLANQLDEENIKGKTVTLKLKRTSFHVILKSKTLSSHTCDSQIIFEAVKNLLLIELENMKTEEAKFRLLGVKISNFDENKKAAVEKGQLTLSGLVQSHKRPAQARGEEQNTEENIGMSEPLGELYEFGIYECSVCGQMFEEKSDLQVHENECIEKSLNIHSDDENGSSPFESLNHELDSLNQEGSSSLEKDVSLMNKFSCPVCFKDNYHSLDELNQHIDICLNIDLCRKLTQLPSTITSQSSSVSTSLDITLIPDKNSNKRSIPKTNQNKSSSNKRKKQEVKEDNNQSKIDSFFHTK